MVLVLFRNVLLLSMIGFFLSYPIMVHLTECSKMIVRVGKKAPLSKVELLRLQYFFAEHGNNCLLVTKMDRAMVRSIMFQLVLAFVPTNIYFLYRSMYYQTDFLERFIIIDAFIAEVCLLTTSLLPMARCTGLLSTYCTSFVDSDLLG